MVNADRIKRKLASLLVGNCSNRRNNKKDWNAFMQSRYRFKQFKKRNPEKFDTLTNKVISALNELERPVSRGS